VPSEYQRNSLFNPDAAEFMYALTSSSVKTRFQILASHSF